MFMPYFIAGVPQLWTWISIRSLLKESSK